MYRKNVASQFVCFQGVDSTNGGIKTGVSWTVRRSIDGTFAAGGGTVTEDGTTGWYKYAMSQADTNGNNISFNFTGTGAVPQTVNIITTAADPTDSVRLGLTALPNAAAEAAGGLYTRGSGAGQINQPANGQIDANTVKIGGTVQTARDIGASVLLSSGTGTGQIKIASGYVAPNWGDVGNPTTTVGLSGTTVATATNLTNAPTNGDLTATMKTSVQTAAAAALTAFFTSAAQLVSDVWSAATRLLTAGTNIVLAKGTGVTGFNDLDAAGVRSAVGLASANLDTQLSALAGFIDTEVAAILTAANAIKLKTDNLPTAPAATGDSMALTAAAVDAILDEVVEGTTTMRQMLRGFSSALLAKASGLGTATAVFRDIGDTKDRITATVDADGNRPAVTTDLT